MSAVPVAPTSLIDCTDATENELLVVEGLSAANAVKPVRDRRLQAVLPMQGKIPNATRVSEERLLAHPNVADLLQSLHPKRLIETQITHCRYKRIVILADPDADGVHASILLLLFIYQYVPSLFEEGRIILLRAPLYGFYQAEECVAIAYSEQHAERVHVALTKATDIAVVKRRFKGIASFDTSLRLALVAPDNPARKILSVDECRDLCQPLLQ